MKRILIIFSLLYTLMGGFPESAMALLQVSPSSIDFADVMVGDSATRTVIVTNKESGSYPNVDVELSGIHMSGSVDFTASNDCPSLLPVSSSFTATVTFSPTTDGWLYATLNLVSSEGTHKVNLSGKGVVEPVPITLFPTYIDFGDVEVGGVRSRSISVANQGANDLTLSVYTNNGYFEYTHNCATLEAYGECWVTIMFKPEYNGRASGELILTWISPSGGANVQVTGVGIGSDEEDHHHDDDDGGGGCFIDTAAHGSSMADDIIASKDSHDNVLLKNSDGTSFLRFHGEVSVPF